jgi:GT2 family glycosyltransferase
METVDFPWLAEPDKDSLAQLMQHVANHREEAATKGKEAAAFIRANFTWDHAAEAVMTRVCQLKGKPIVRHAPAVDSASQVRPMHRELTSIILTFNELEYSQRCVDSIQMHTPEPYEIIFVDNGSMDGTVEWIRKIVKKNANFKLTEDGKNLGFTKGCNQGIQAASGDYILLLNNDVVVTAGWLSGMLDQIKADPNIGMVGPMTNLTSAPQLVGEVPYGDDLDRMHAFAADFRGANAGKVAYEWHLSGFCLLIRRKLLDIIGGFDEGYGCGGYENEDLCLRSVLAGYRHVIARDVFVHHYIGRTLVDKAIDGSSTCESDYEYFGRKWARFVTTWTKSATERGYTVTQNITGQDCIDELLRWGEDCFVRGEIKRAVRVFERLLSLNSQNAQAMNNLGVIQWQLGDVASAINIFQRSLSIKPNDSDTLANLTQAATEARRFDLLKPGLLKIVQQAQPANSDIARLIDGHQGNVCINSRH